MSFTDLGVKPLFATPLITAKFSPEIYEPLNRELKALILNKMQDSSGVAVSNVGGWQSDHQLPIWGGEPVTTLLRTIRDVLKQVTLYMDDHGVQRGDIDWKINGWANVNHKGDRNADHTHPGAYWSACYYVQVNDNTNPAHPTGGEFKAHDPRGSMPLMYCPLLRFGLQGYTTAGTAELHKPEAGQCLIFPSWLNHAVMPHSDDSQRISLAFNFSV